MSWGHTTHLLWEEGAVVELEGGKPSILTTPMLNHEFSDAWGRCGGKRDAHVMLADV